MKLRPLQDLAEENFPFVCEPVHARFWLNNAFRDYVRIEDFGEHLKNCEREACQLEGDPDHWNGRLLGYERLLAYITRGSLVLVMEPGDFPLHPMDRAFVQKADEHWEPDPDNIWEPGIREHLAYRAEHLHHEHQERERYAANHPPAREPEYLPATGPGFRKPTLGPQEGGAASNSSKKSVTPQEANQLFEDAKANDKIPFDYPLDCCYSRAHEMCRQFESKGVECGKAWFYGEEFAAGGASLKAATPVNAVTPKGYVNWTYHVAPTITVTDGSTTKTQVIDPSLFDKPVDVSAWTNRMNDPKGKLEFSDSSPYFRMPGNSAALKDDDYSKATEQMEKHARERDRKIRAANKTK